MDHHHWVDPWDLWNPWVGQDLHLLWILVVAGQQRPVLLQDLDIGHLLVAELVHKLRQPFDDHHHQ